jgi:hypothetical protein
MQSERGARPVATLAKMSKAKALRGSRIFALGVVGDAEETAWTACVWVRGLVNRIVNIGCE